MVWFWHCFVCVWERENKTGRKHHRQMATTIRSNQQSMQQPSRSWRCIDWSFHIVIWRKEGNHTCKTEVIAGFSLRNLKVKTLAFNGTRFDVKTTICRKDTKTTPVIGRLENLNYQIFISNTTSTSIWLVRVGYHQRNFHHLKELLTTMVFEPIIRCYGHSLIISNTKQQTGDGNWMTKLLNLLWPTKKSHQNHRQRSLDVIAR